MGQRLLLLLRVNDPGQRFEARRSSRRRSAFDNNYYKGIGVGAASPQHLCVCILVCIFILLFLFALVPPPPRVHTHTHTLPIVVVPVRLLPFVVASLVSGGRILIGHR